MARFSVSGSGVVDLRDTDIIGYDGISFQTDGDLRIQLKFSQFGPVMALPSDSTFEASGFKDTVEIFLDDGSTFLGSSFTLAGWSGLDRFLFRDSIFNENITGTQGNDTFFVTGGTDAVDGNLGADDLLVVRWQFLTNSVSTTGSGFTNFSDTAVNFSNIDRFDVKLGSGDDQLTTGAGDDVVYGGGGNDTINTAKGKATVQGEAGNDLWMADFSDDATVKTITLGVSGMHSAGNGTSYGGIERLSVLGGGGNDVFVTLTNNSDDGLIDTLNGGGGNDRFTIGGGNDSVDGGSGTDTLTINYATEHLALQMSNASTITDFSNTSVVFANVEQFIVTLGTGNDNIDLLDGNDTINGGDGSDRLNTAKGRAIVDGGAGDDLWVADFSNDATVKTIDLNLASGVAGNGSTYASVERLDIIGGKGNDSFLTRMGNPNDGLNDTVRGGEGNDTIRVGGGLDTVDGGVGDDLLIVDYANETLALSMSNASTITDFSNTQVMFQGIERFDVTLGSGNDNIDLLNGTDTINGGGGDDRLNTAKGAAIVDGGSGADLWAADFSDDSTVKTIDLNRTVVSDAGNGSSYIRIERLDITGGSGDDMFLTRRGNPDDGFNDTVRGGDGDDTIRVGGGMDTVNGGADDDLLIVDYANEMLALTMSNAATITDFSNTQVTFQAIERFDVTLGSGNDSIDLLNGSDTIKGGGGNDRLNTAKGVAIVDGGDGADLWVSDFSDDATAKTIDLNVTGVGSAGNGSKYARVERLDFIGGVGDDRILTKSGNTGDGNDDVVKTGLGSDTIRVGGGFDTVNGGDNDDLLIIDYASETLGLSMSNASTLTDFSNTQVTFQAIERFDVTLGSGNDSIDLLNGSDTIRGGDGDDRLNTAKGTAIVDGGDGTDLWVADFADDTIATTINLNLTGVGNTGNNSKYVRVERLDFTGGTGNDVVLTKSGNPNDGYNDVVKTGLGNDTIRVGGGMDTVDGGADNDLLIIDYASETLGLTMSNASTITDFSNTQVAFQGIERLDVTLGSGGDTVTLGDGDDILRGGAGNDTLRGGGGADLIDGGTGQDALYGDLGDDTFVVDSNGDSVFETANGGTDTVNASVSFSLVGQSIEKLVLAGTAALSATGNADANTITGNAGSNTINGGAGADILSGKGGDDIYIVDDAGDRVFETANNGTDVVRSSVSFSLVGQAIENLSLTGSAAVNATGNSADNLLSGNLSANTLEGGGGNDEIDGRAGGDTMRGGAGDDSYFIDNIKDTVVELANEGTDTVNSSISFSLAGIAVETLVLIGDGAVNATGNSGANSLNGNSAGNIIDGGGNADLLTGGAGADSFAFSTALGSSNVDRITDFSSVDDAFQLSKSVFGALSLGALASTAFKEVTAFAVDANDRILYNKTTGAVFYDVDGSGAGAAIQFATLDNLVKISAADFFVV